MNRGNLDITHFAMSELTAFSANRPSSVDMIIELRMLRSFPLSLSLLRRSVVGRRLSNKPPNARPPPRRSNKTLAHACLHVDENNEYGYTGKGQRWRWRRLDTPHHSCGVQEPTHARATDVSPRPWREGKPVANSTTSSTSSVVSGRDWGPPLLQKTTSRVFSSHV